MTDFFFRPAIWLFSSVTSITSGGLLVFASRCVAAPEGVLFAAAPAPALPVPNAELLGIGGIIIGAGTAIAGVVIPLAKSYFADRQARRDHELRVLRIQADIDRMDAWAHEISAWGSEVRRKAYEAGISLPTHPGPPPKTDPTPTHYPEPSE